MMKLALKHGPYLLNAEDDCGYTPLMIAVLTGKIKLVKLLLKHGAPKGTICRKRTAHDIAILCGYKDIATIVQ